MLLAAGVGTRTLAVEKNSYVVGLHRPAYFALVAAYTQTAAPVLLAVGAV